MPKPLVSRRTLKRSSVIALGLVAIFLFLACRIFAIQVFDFTRYQKKVIDQLTTESPVRAKRGEILDAAGRVLATNQTVYRVSIFPNVIARADDSEKAAALIAEGLSSIVQGLEKEAVLEHIAHTSELERTVIRETDTETANAILAFIGEHDLHEMLTVNHSGCTRAQPSVMELPIKTTLFSFFAFAGTSLLSASKRLMFATL